AVRFCAVGPPPRPAVLPYTTLFRSWHDTFAGLTPPSVWRPLRPGQDPGDLSELAELVRPLRGGPGVVKDYVKSCKHEWEEACFRSEEHTSELQSRENLVCRLLLEKK